ncbi:MAG: carboxymuconolactone decarboxylase family protein [Reyranella sp.]|jgi:alkylhydroperoxidase/carboxymuconolactone decarboxylase family protein YurZ|uniref:carboxymuconolactone decarboxylase family protein n=1 Tax=Reyranella sp. TaxID=1929291 RepID=UPI0025FE8089|nr:carboxymuconolactone decarboxylase family protein [Reyranella sp.]MBR2817130.1 carboxymuconolactone decarboxylase family protein [Reyranella sp.]
MSNTALVKHHRASLRASAAALFLGLLTVLSPASYAQDTKQMNQAQATALSASDILTARQQAIVPIGAFAAAGDIPKLNTALNQGLDAGLSVSDTKEILVQLYAYAGFPRSLNALGELMKVLEARKQRGIQDAPGHLPSRAIPKGDALLATGTANQTKLAGAPVKGPLFDFAPTIDEYLKAHLFGDIFERDNLDWQSRELATVGMLSALPGAESQLQSHMRISMNVGLTIHQLRQLAQVLADRVDSEHARRAREALERQLAAKPGVK